MITSVKSDERRTEATGQGFGDNLAPIKGIEKNGRTGPQGEKVA